MSSTLSPASKPRRLRPAALHGRGGASSLLRLSRAASALPSGSALADWASRAAALLERADDDAASWIAPLAAGELALR